MQIRDRIVGMQPQQATTQHGYQETAVDLRLDGVQLPQLLALLVALEQAPYDVQVHHLQIKPKYDNPDQPGRDAPYRVLCQSLIVLARSLPSLVRDPRVFRMRKMNEAIALAPRPSRPGSPRRPDSRIRYRRPPRVSRGRGLPRQL